MTKHKFDLSQGKRLALALVVGISAIGLVGCGDGSNSNGTNVSVGAPAGVSLTKFVVENKSGYDIKALRLLNAAGKPLTNAAQSSAPFSCANGSTCDFRASMQEAGVIQFYNSQNKLVAVDIIIKAPGEQQQVSTSAYTLGLFLFNELRNRYPDGAQAKLRKMNRFFENYEGVATGEANKFEALGQYYRQQTLTKGVDDDTFFKELNARLLANEVLPANQFSMRTASLIGKLWASLKQIELISSAHAEEGTGCPKALTDTLSIANLFTSFIPGGGLVHEMVSIGCEVAKTEPNYEKEFKELNTKLDDIQKTVDTVYLNVNKGIDLQAKLAVTSALSEAQKVVNKEETPLTLYKDLIKDKGSLKALIESNKSTDKKEKRGPFQITWEKNTALNNLLGERNPVNDWNTLKDLNITTERTAFITALNEFCELKERSDLNRIDRTEQCNAAIVNYQALILKTYLKAMAMYKDISDTINYYKTSGTKSDREFLAKNFTWQGYDYQTMLLPELQSGLKQATEGFVTDKSLALAGSNDVYFDPLGGLPSRLVSRLKDPALECLAKDGKTPNVSDWRYDKHQSYIEVACSDKGHIKRDSTFMSHYYYDVSADASKGYGEVDAHSPINIMGVLMPQGYDAGQGLYDNRPEIEASWIYVPDAWSTLSMNKQAGASSGLSFPSQNSFPEGFRITRRANEGSNKVFYVSRGNARGSSAQNQIGPEAMMGALYMRQTDAKGLSYVGSLLVGTGSYLSEDAERPTKMYGLRFAMTCAGNYDGCKVRMGDGIADALSFTGGPDIYSHHYTSDRGEWMIKFRDKK